MSPEQPDGSRPAAPADVTQICGSQPRTWFGTSWGDVATWLVVARAGSVAGEDTGRGFAIDRSRGSSVVLVRLSRLGETTRAELVEVLTDAWAALAPRSVVREHLG